MEIIGTYQETMERDDYNGETIFRFHPIQYCKFAENGNLNCIGIIPDFPKKVPLILKGNMYQNYFYVTKYEIASLGQETSLKLIEYFFEGTNEKLTDGQINKILKISNEDILGFLKQDDAVDQIYKIVKSKKKLDYIIKRGRSLLEHEKIVKLCLPLHIPMDKISALIRLDITYSKLEKNPYLYCNMADISIYDSDAIKEKLSGVDPYDTQRIYGYIADAMKNAKKQGHTCVTIQQLCNAINYKLKNSAFPDCEFGCSLINYILVAHNPNNFFSMLKIENEVYVYETKVLEEENSVIQNVLRLQESATQMVESIDIEEIENDIGIQYSEDQKKAFDFLKKGGIGCLIGPPGSGKTVLINGLVKAYEKQKNRCIINLCATTGRASQIMAENCGREAKTIHKLLDIRPFDNSYISKDLNNPIAGSLIIVDEVSMLDLELASHLLKSVKSGSALLFVGDKNQLQSVGYGNILADLMESGMIPYYELKEIKRQSGVICRNAYRVNKGQNSLENDAVFQIFHFTSEDEALQKLKENLSINSSQVLSPVKAGVLGTKMCNKLIQNMLPEAKNKPYLKYGDLKFFVGCRVIMTRTDYSLGYYNGSIGIITAINQGNVMIHIEDKIITLPRNHLSDMDVAYAITIHKSQGSECDDIHIVLPDDNKNMLTRRLLYTAITRAKKKVYVYEINNAVDVAIHNVNERKRITLLGKRLQHLRKDSGSFYRN